MTDNDILKFFQGLQCKRAEKDVIMDYIFGKITKEMMFEQIQEVRND